MFQNATFWAFGAYGPKPSKGLHSRCRNRRTPKTPLGETAQLETCRDLLTILWDLLMKQVTREGKRMMGPYNLEVRFGFPLCFQCSFRYPYEGKLNFTAESTQRPKSFLTSLLRTYQNLCNGPSKVLCSATANGGQQLQQQNLHPWYVYVLSSLFLLSLL